MILYDINDKVNRFMFAYMYELEIALRTQKDNLATVSFQSDEANTDRPLKLFLKDFIEKKFNSLPSYKTDFKFNITINDTIESFSYRDFNNIKIKKALSPEEISSELKSKIAENKSSVYTNPDLLLEISDGSNSTHCSIELKSTKNNSIPGSSIQQINPTEWVIFIKHTSKDIDITTGQYIHSINSKLQFPDRSPRPQVAFNELTSWNASNRSLDNTTLNYTINSNDEKLKYDLISDWQYYLADRWIEVLFSSSIKNNEPWYNNNLRKFIVKFLEKYDNLTPDEKEDFKTKVKSLIK